jgi:hypothetical protein
VGQLMEPRGIRLLPDGSGLVVVDSGNSRLCVFSLVNDDVQVLDTSKKTQMAMEDAHDVIPTEDGFFVVGKLNSLVRLSRSGTVTSVYGIEGPDTEVARLRRPTAISALPSKSTDF